MKSEFEAGGDLGGDSTAMFQAAIDGAGAPAEPAPTEAPAAEVGTEQEHVADTWSADASTQDVNQETPTESEDTQPSSESSEPEVDPVSGKTIQVKYKGKDLEFNLDAEDPKLKKAIELGLGARGWQRERDEALRALKQHKDQIPELEEKAKVWGQLEELVQGDQLELAAQAVLGQEGFARLQDRILEGYRISEGGDPDERYQWEQARSEREQSWKEQQYERRIQELEARQQDREDGIERDRLRSLGTDALVKYDFRSHVEDQDTAAALNKKLWQVSFTDLEDLVDQGREATPELVRKVFARNAKIMRGGMGKVAKAAVAQTIEAKKQSAKQEARVAATERYPQGQGQGQNKLEGWNGTDAKDLLKRMFG